MKKLPQKTLEAIVDGAAELKVMIEAANAILVDAAERLQTAYQEIDAKRADLSQIVSDAIEPVEGYFDERSEKWSESDAGTAFSNWIETLRDFQSTVDETIEEPEVPECEVPDWISEILDGETSFDRVEE